MSPLIKERICSDGTDTEAYKMRKVEETCQK